MLTESPNSLFNCQRPRRFRPRAASSGPREPGEVTHPRSSRQELFFNFRTTVVARRVAAFRLRRSVSTLTRAARQHIFSTLFRSLSRPEPCLVFPKRRRVSTRPLPARQHLFFQIFRVACAPRPSFGFPKWRSVFTHPLPARQLFFSTSSKRRCPSMPRAAFRSREGASRPRRSARQA